MGIKYLTQKQLNIIRGKAMVGKASPKEILSVFEHYDLIEMELDERDGEDYFGTEGWRHSFRLPDSD
jgi:hypothetical protein